MKKLKVINNLIFLLSIALIIIGIMLQFISNNETTFIKIMWNNHLINRFSYNEMLLQNKYALNNFDYFKGVWLDFEVVGILLLFVNFTQNLTFKKVMNIKIIKQKIKKEKNCLINYFNN